MIDAWTVARPLGQTRYFGAPSSVAGLIVPCCRSMLPPWPVAGVPVKVGASIHDQCGLPFSLPLILVAYAA